MTFSLLNIIDDYAGFNPENFEPISFDPKERQTIFEKFRLYVASKARGKRRQRILSTPISGVNRCGILRRLTYDTETDFVDYCCGQEWYSEMAILRNAFD